MAKGSNQPLTSYREFDDEEFLDEDDVPLPPKHAHSTKASATWLCYQCKAIQETFIQEGNSKEIKMATHNIFISV